MEHLRLQKHYLELGALQLNWIGAIVLLIGMVCLWASLGDKKWYWKLANIQGRAFQQMIGQTGYRYFCIAINLVLSIAGGLLLLAPPLG